eukprot:CAMPEP_0202039400 /NCGR_PEP_ID=MMETSP0962-20130828/15982_1 /ASSEMBLY_ACC=CAM_ASM_000488 /TAXON_ID=4773 /ORGANISM="Schizochytrium aggregatum, Strain ATCC28209" /LENGTH=235 /DNA_ID=CAMNT_0048603613 /DNA_START=152 /DNA_END=855 /DNA_ORIENTATION=-
MDRHARCQTEGEGREGRQAHEHGEAVAVVLLEAGDDGLGRGAEFLQATLVGNDNVGALHLVGQRQLGSDAVARLLLAQAVSLDDAPHLLLLGRGHHDDLGTHVQQVLGLVQRGRVDDDDGRALAKAPGHLLGDLFEDGRAGDGGELAPLGGVLEHDVAELLPVEPGAVLLGHAAAEGLDDRAERGAPRLDHLARDHVAVHHRDAALAQLARHRGLAAGDAPGEAQHPRHRARPLA